MKQLLSIALADRDADRVRRNHEDAIRELQALPCSGLRIARANLELADGVTTPVPHGLGRAAFVVTSPVRGASSTGRIEEIRDGGFDRNKVVVLKATGWGATITVDVWVM